MRIVIKISIQQNHNNIQRANDDRVSIGYGTWKHHKTVNNCFIKKKFVQPNHVYGEILLFCFVFYAVAENIFNNDIYIGEN